MVTIASYTPSLSVLLSSEQRLMTFPDISARGGIGQEYVAFAVSNFDRLLVIDDHRNCRSQKRMTGGVTTYLVLSSPRKRSRDPTRLLVVVKPDSVLHK